MISLVDKLPNEGKNVPQFPPDHLVAFMKYKRGPKTAEISLVNDAGEKVTFCGSEKQEPVREKKARLALEVETGTVIVPSTVGKGEWCSTANEKGIITTMTGVADRFGSNAMNHWAIECHDCVNARERKEVYGCSHHPLNTNFVYSGCPVYSVAFTNQMAEVDEETANMSVKKANWLFPDELENLATYCFKEVTAAMLMFYVMFVVAINLCLRVSEVCSLKVEDICTLSGVACPYESGQLLSLEYVYI